MNKMKVAKM